VTHARVPLDDVGIEARRPGVHRVLVSAVQDPPADLPVVTIVGERPGPLVIAAAGVHGNEYEGPPALWQVARDLRPSSLRGRVVLLPICNPWAFARGRRETPDEIDGVNLARAFPGDPHGTPTQRLAAALLAFLERLGPTLFLDLHSGGALYRFLPMVGYREGLGDVARAREAARAFGVPALWALGDHPGTFNAETARRGILTVGVEMTGAGGCLEEDVAADYDGVFNLLRWLGMLADRPAPRVRGPFHRMTNVLSIADGYAEPVRAIGDPVRAGEPVARVRSPLGEAVAEIPAPHDGAVWVTRHLRTIRRREMICAVAAPLKGTASG